MSVLSHHLNDHRVYMADTEFTQNLGRRSGINSNSVVGLNKEECIQVSAGYFEHIIDRGRVNSSLLLQPCDAYCLLIEETRDISKS